MPILQLKHRVTDDTPPPSLMPGEAAVYAGTGDVKIWVGDAAGAPVQLGSGVSGFVKRAGDTMYGQLSMVYATPMLLLTDTAAAAGRQSWGLRENNGNLHLSPRNDDGSANANSGAMTIFSDSSGRITDVQLTPGNVALGTPVDNSVMTRLRGDARYINTAGDTMTGALILNAKPTVALGAATKSYVDDLLATYYNSAAADARYVNVTGDTMTGSLTLPATNPTNDNHATRKAYVDAQVATKIDQTFADGRYSQLGHTHTESQITNLDRLRWRGAWASGTYPKNDVVSYQGIIYVASVASVTTTPPGSGWTQLGARGANVTFADAAPTGQPGDLWYKTSAPVGLYGWYVDADSSQWISMDQAAALAAGFVKKTGDSMSGQLNLLAGNPTAAAHAANKAYVDAQVATRLTQATADTLYAPLSSDRTLKQFIQPMAGALDKALALTPRTYEWKVNDRPHKVAGTIYGVVAQEVAEVLPTAVYDAGAYKAVDALSLIGVLLGAVHELNSKLEALTNG